MERQKALQRLHERSNNILEHLAAIGREPESRARYHWIKEMRNWLNDMVKMLPHVGRRTADLWRHVVNAYRVILEELP